MEAITDAISLKTKPWDVPAWSTGWVTKVRAFEQKPQPEEDEGKTKESA
jgi:hypothetical protein